VTLQRTDGVGWYVRDPGTGRGGNLWYIEADRATRMDVTNPTGGVGTYFAANPGETIWQALRRMTPWFEGMADPGPFHPMKLDPGQYYRRIARPITMSESDTLWLPDTASERRYITGAQNQLASLIDDLRTICRVVQPSPGTLSVYGHEIRNLLILAATEVEMHWRGILVANGKKVKGSTGQYVALADPLRLREFSVHFHPCPDMDPVMPFADWDADKASKSLAWYTAYNGVKHNREFEFEQATLGNAFNAIAACAVMLVAQFGQSAVTGELSSFLSVEAPTWSMEDMYFPPQEGADWEPVPHPDLS